MFIPCACTLSHVRLFCDSMDCSPLGSSVHGILQARILEWIAIPFSKGSSWLRDPPGKPMHAYMLTHICMYIYVYYMHIIYTWGFPGSSDSKEFTCNTGDLGSMPGLGRSPGGGQGNPLQYIHLENPWLWYTGSQRVGHSWSNWARMHVHISSEMKLFISNPCSTMKLTRLSKCFCS